MTTESSPNGVLLMAYGAPRTLEDVGPYYTHIRGGREPRPDQIEELKERYRKIGGESPLLRITEAQARALETQLNWHREQYRTFVGMKHWHPFIREAVEAMASRGIERVVALALAPHYSRMSVGGYLRAVDEALEALGDSMEVLPVESYHAHSGFIEAVAGKVRQGVEAFPQEVRREVQVVFTAHSLPQRILDEGDPYQDQLLETCRLVAEQVGLASWHFAYQSAGHTNEPWLGPDITQLLPSLAAEGHWHVLTTPVGFVADHLEILYDLDYEAQELARSLDLSLRRTESLNDDPIFISALADVVQKKLEKS